MEYVEMFVRSNIQSLCMWLLFKTFLL